MVLCPPELRRKGCYNGTRYHFRDNGNLEPEDDDVILDPYHMCLLYQLHKELNHPT